MFVSLKVFDDLVEDAQLQRVQLFVPWKSLQGCTMKFVTKEK